MLDIPLIVLNDPERWEQLRPVTFAEKIERIEKICCRLVAFYSLYEPSIAYGVSLEVLDGKDSLCSSHIMTVDDFRNRIEQHCKSLELLFRFPSGVKIAHQSESAVVHMYTVKIGAEVYRKEETRNKDLAIMQNKLKESLKKSLGELLM